MAIVIEKKMKMVIFQIIVQLEITQNSENIFQHGENGNISKYTIIAYLQNERMNMSDVTGNSA